VEYLLHECGITAFAGAGLAINSEDVARLSPLVHAHINVLGRYQFDVSEAIQQGGNRPLRNPNDPKEYDD
jgi:hypothetical protein